MDKFKSMTELVKQTKENEDWEIVSNDLRSNVTILAIHGGGIEPATTELACVIAEQGQYNYFAFNGIRSKGNNELHVTSINYDNETAMNLVNDSDIAVTIHGCSGDESVAYIGGKDIELKEAIGSGLANIGIDVQAAPSNMAGAQDNNIVNRTTKGAGVQIELSSKLRKSLFKNRKSNFKSRQDQSNWDDLMYEIAKAINKAIESLN
ncbi:hypothetical protein E2558_03200 [Staphylococcus pragensis]|uniref:Phage-related replication protein n=1 Tax=Staphylococcus pragensis TaxID=1611836 RepID=A0A4Z1BAL8_9STAP|nr:poly-gamma-glutamate hydrolase family protein [Staphylococcus pragensis]RTX87359.1 hypothetical protein CD154_10295 [Staphylococcus carnosus]TGN28656.1 hypothetical protein E2558_03200 [Staphylococcus pragensis]GGG86057.1 hypothetical protein GCM10007342_04810 [Staphylococcus pragensis]